MTNNVSHIHSAHSLRKKIVSDLFSKHKETSFEEESEIIIWLWLLNFISKPKLANCSSFEL